LGHERIIAAIRKECEATLVQIADLERQLIRKTSVVRLRRTSAAIESAMPLSCPFTSGELLEMCRAHRGLDPRDPLEAVADPHWWNASRKDDWRNVVPTKIADVEPLLSLESRLAAYYVAAIQTLFDD
jgi:hypothetical protein